MVEVENQKLAINNQDEMTSFIRRLLDKAYYSGETLCLEALTVGQDGKKVYREIDRWK
jgi:hypothetical protein